MFNTNTPCDSTSKPARLNSGALSLRTDARGGTWRQCERHAPMWQHSYINMACTSHIAKHGLDAVSTKHAGIASTKFLSNMHKASSHVGPRQNMRNMPASLPIRFPSNMHKASAHVGPKKHASIASNKFYQTCTRPQTCTKPFPTLGQSETCQHRFLCVKTLGEVPGGNARDMHQRGNIAKNGVQVTHS